MFSKLNPLERFDRRVKHVRGVKRQKMWKSSLGPLLENTPICHKLVIFIKPSSTNPMKWWNTLKQFFGKSRQIVWVCLTSLWGWRLKDQNIGIKNCIWLLLLLEKGIRLGKLIWMCCPFLGPALIFYQDLV